MMSDLPDLDGLLDAERKRLKRKKPDETPEQRERRRARARWHNHVDDIWRLAQHLTDDEWRWFATVLDASAAKGKHKVSTWSHGTLLVDRPTNSEDALRLVKLISLLQARDRRRDQLRHKTDHATVAATLLRLGLPVPARQFCGYYAVLDRVYDEGGDA
jgi:hypothetical protein